MKEKENWTNESLTIASTVWTLIHDKNPIRNNISKAWRWWIFRRRSWRRLSALRRCSETMSNERNEVVIVLVSQIYLLSSISNHTYTVWDKSFSLVGSSYTHIAMRTHNFKEHLSTRPCLNQRSCIMGSTIRYVVNVILKLRRSRKSNEHGPRDIDSSSRLTLNLGS